MNNEAVEPERTIFDMENNEAWLLLDHVYAHPVDRATLHRLLDEALATERRATVERIRHAIFRRWDEPPYTNGYVLRNISAVLDEEAAR